MTKDNLDKLKQFIKEADREYAKRAQDDHCFEMRIPPTGTAGHIRLYSTPDRDLDFSDEWHRLARGILVPVMCDRAFWYIPWLARPETGFEFNWEGGRHGLAVKEFNESVKSNNLEPISMVGAAATYLIKDPGKDVALTGCVDVYKPFASNTSSNAITQPSLEQARTALKDVATRIGASACVLSFPERAFPEKICTIVARDGEVRHYSL